MEKGEENDFGFACAFDTLDQRDLRHILIKDLHSAAREIRELLDGYVLHLPGEEAWLRKLTDFIALERVCCPFLAWTLECESNAGPIWLRIRGPAGVKKFLRAEVAASLYLSI